MKKIDASWWRDHPNEVFTIKGKKYDYRSAAHNGLVGDGALLKQIIAAANKEQEG